jgi:hypothetical protein
LLKIKIPVKPIPHLFLIFWVFVTCKVKNTRRQFKNVSNRRTKSEQKICNEMPQCTHPQKMALLTEILARKKKLFAGFSAATTSYSIGLEWDDLWQWCLAARYPFCKETKGADYLRYTTWANWKSMAIVGLMINWPITECTILLAGTPRSAESDWRRR